MLFNSWHFICFFPIVTFLYFSIAHRYRWIFLLIASYYFYMSWHPAYILLIVTSTCIDFWAAKQIESCTNPQKRKQFLWLSVSMNLGLLGFFKYFNFFNDNFIQLFNLLSIPYHIPNHDFLLPVGISFYTFQTLSYTIDVYRGRMKTEKHLGKFALYVSFFPQLVAGPIERAKNLLPQLYAKSQFNYQRIKEGLQLMLWGFFLKLVIGDRIGIFADEVYDNPERQHLLSILLGMFFFIFQIFCDFAAYSKIAIGVAHILGIKLNKNFNHPYAAESLVDFMRRWHMTLMAWFKDYIYIPLVKKGFHRDLVLMIVYLITGIWHGASWSFICWGLFLGLWTLFERFYVLKFYSKIKKEFPTLGKWFARLITFHVFAFSGLFFRADSLQTTWTLINRMSHFSWHINILNNKSELVLSIILVVFLEIINYWKKDKNFFEFLHQRPLLFRWFFYLLLLSSILFLGIPNQNNFYYFQF